MLKWLCLLFASVSFASDEYQILDRLAIDTNADKGSFYHNYTEVYAKYLAPLREKRIKFLEIGISEGNSVKMWEQYFPNAELHFMDITLHKVKYHSGRSIYHLADQESTVDLKRFIRETQGGFDIILDDGGHTANQQIISFQALFPHLNSGGIYIIEDMHTSYWDCKPENSGIAYFKTLIDELNYVGAKTGRGSRRNLSEQVLSALNLHQKEIDSIHFHTSLVIVIKR